MTIEPDLAGSTRSPPTWPRSVTASRHVAGGTLSQLSGTCRSRGCHDPGWFGPARCLIALEAENTLWSLTVYLAAIRASGHPLLILPPGGGQASETLIAAYDPDIVARSAQGDCVLHVSEASRPWQTNSILTWHFWSTLRDPPDHRNLCVSPAPPYKPTPPPSPSTCTCVQVTPQPPRFPSPTATG